MENPFFKKIDLSGIPPELCSNLSNYSSYNEYFCIISEIHFFYKRNARQKKSVSGVL